MGILSDVLKGMGLNSFQRALGAVLTLAVGLILIKYLMKLVGRALSRSRLEKAAHSMVLGILQVTLYLLLGINVASALGIDVTGVVAVASVLTLAVSLAMQNLLTNLVGGFTILTTHPFHSGDYVDIGEESGTVDEISMTYTRLITPDPGQQGGLCTQQHRGGRPDYQLYCRRNPSGGNQGYGFL